MRKAAVRGLGKELVFGPRTNNLKEFEALSREAKATGFTHIDIAQLSERTDYRGEDKDSPWCEWSAIIPSIFKCVTPPGLEDAFPASFVKRQMAFMKAKYGIVKKLDMRAAYFGLEPHWLSERVYRKHPEWRGPRTDNPVRATGMFFAPNTDHPEVRLAYRHAMKELARQFPRLDIFQFHTNDSGAFFSWGKRLFSGPNGPTGYEAAGRDMGLRVADFLSTLRDGSAEGGVDAHIFTSAYRWFSDDETHLVLRSLKPGIGVAGVAPEPNTAESSIINCGGWGWSNLHLSPMIDRLPTPGAVVRGVSSVKTSKVRRYFTAGNTKEYFEAFKSAMTMPAATSEKKKVDVLMKMASDMYSPDVAEDVVDAWTLMEKAETMSGVGRVDLLGGPVMMRWLTRPLVADQGLLTESERSYWQKYIYQSQPSHPDAWLDYLNVTNIRVAKTWDEASVTCCAVDAIAGTLAAAADKLQAASGNLKDKKAAERLLLDSYRVRVWRCLALTNRHYLQVGTLIYLRDAQNAVAPKTTLLGGDEPDMPMGTLGSHGLWFMYRAIRWELDNMVELIGLLKKSPVPLLYTAPAKSLAGPLFLEPEIEKNLQKKVDTMLKYWRSAENGYYLPTLGG